MEPISVKPMAIPVVEVPDGQENGRTGMDPQTLSLYLSLSPEDKRKVICMINGLLAERGKETQP